MRGRAAHSSQPHLGDNAIYKMARVIPVFERYQTEVTPTLKKHHLCGSPTLSVGTIQGGVSVNTVPDQLQGRPVLVLDPMLATGGSLVHTCSLLRDAGAGRLRVVCVLAAPEGVEAFGAAGFDSELYTAAIDERLNDQAFIVPGLGDAGDRQFGLA